MGVTKLSCRTGGWREDPAEETCWLLGTTEGKGWLNVAAWWAGAAVGRVCLES